MEKMIICYFSASGTTKTAAEKLSSITNSNLFEIEPVDEYSEKDLDWQDKNSRSSIEMSDVTSRPEMKDKLENIEDYTKVLIGYPIWWDLAPRIINTFIEHTNLNNKKVYLFATSGGSGIEGSVTDLRRTYPNINFVRGKRLNETITNDEILSWLG